jgi:hypothetical protein
MELIDDILPKTTNVDIIRDLVRCNYWGLAIDTETYSEDHILLNMQNNKCFGFYFISYENNKPTLNTPLNIYAKIILDSVLEKAKLNVRSVKRFYWNLYFPGHESALHTDENTDDFLTIIYNLHTTDGGTLVDNVFYKDKIGQAKLFNSNLVHKGIGPKKDNYRFNLNIVLKK